MPAPGSIAMHMRDYIFMIALIGCSLIVFSNFDSYDPCPYPLNIWLIADFSAFVLFRVVQFLYQWSTHRRRRRRRRDRRRCFPMFLAVFNIFLVYPFLWAWTGIGTWWYIQSSPVPDCLPQERSHFWFIAWITYSFIYLTAFLALIITRIRQRRRDPQLDWFASILGNITRVPEAEVARQESSGLSRSELNDIPIFTLTDDHIDGGAEESCSICLGDLTPGETARDLICGHLFHQECLDQWLSIKNSCPNCVQRVAGAHAGTSARVSVALPPPHTSDRSALLEHEHGPPRRHQPA